MSFDKVTFNEYYTGGYKYKIKISFFRNRVLIVWQISLWT